ncbi:hypothetical protein [Actinokineospora bangkokensis]|uniref:Uncharacterized protein n=1 Tax=Actinokineospora bangkokensis TaxID=1193682 RepID=A0A1Q9LC11_9PSEU|nr:hypothetical protein [Actinokineospora bangkokensis]OLR89546.1 hypothetical protein BJP25_05575 [Actinokineospora bangkokensis]
MLAHYNGLRYASVHSFLEFVHRTPPSELSPDNLADYIRAWMLDGSGVWACRYQFAKLQIAIHFVVDRWQRYPSSLSYWLTPGDPSSKKIERVADRFLPVGTSYHGELHDIHNYGFFATCVETDWARRLERYHEKKRLKRLGV